MLEKYKEPCAICDYVDTEVKTSLVKNMSKDINFNYLSSYIFCPECGFEFVNEELSEVNYQSRSLAKNHAQEWMLIERYSSCFKKIAQDIIERERIPYSSTGRVLDGARKVKAEYQQSVKVIDKMAPIMSGKIYNVLQWA